MKEKVIMSICTQRNHIKKKSYICENIQGANDNNNNNNGGGG
jgi:hypothetical protein